MTAPSSSAPTADPRLLAASLVPALRDACGGRLSDVTWFKADWQRGGAATGTGQYQLDGGPEKVVVKIPVGQRELGWITRLQATDEGELVVPRVYAAGSSVGGYDLAWVVMERFPYGPLGTKWHRDHVARIADAAARFHAAADTQRVDQGPRIEPWEDIIEESLASVRRNDVPEPRAWRNELKALNARLEPLVTEWRQRDVRHWLHGDLHLANAMSREALDHGPVCLIDLAEVHAGHWIEDAVYLERQLWARPDRLKATRPVRAIVDARRAKGLPVDEDYPRLAMIRRALLAGSAPKFIRSEGHPAHLEACREWLDRALTELT